MSLICDPFDEQRNTRNIFPDRENLPDSKKFRNNQCEESTLSNLVYFEPIKKPKPDYDPTILYIFAGVALSLLAAIVPAAWYTFGLAG